MNCLILFDKDMVDIAHARLAGVRIEHAFERLPTTIGQVLTVGLLNGNLGTGTIAAINPESIDLDISLDKKPPAPSSITLICALPRPKSMRKVVHAAVTLGIKKIILLETWNVDKGYWQTPWLFPDYLYNLSIIALEQAVDTIMPSIELKKKFKPFVEDELPQLIGQSLCFIAHPHSGAICPSDIRESVTLAIGPEGGFNDYELGKFEGLGFARITLGQRQLRVEEAVAAIVGRLL